MYSNQTIILFGGSNDDIIHHIKAFYWPSFLPRAAIGKSKPSTTSIYSVIVIDTPSQCSIMFSARSSSRICQVFRHHRPARLFSAKTSFAGDHVRIVEVGPRDGLQNEKKAIPLNTKLDLIERLAKTGLTTIEAGSFVPEKWVPQVRRIVRLLWVVSSLYAYLHFEFTHSYLSTQL